MKLSQDQKQLHGHCRKCGKSRWLSNDNVCHCCQKSPREFSIFIWQDGSIHSFAGHNENAEFVKVREII